MAITRVRRIEAQTGPSLHDRISREALSCAWSRAEANAIERDHPELIVERAGNLLAAFREGEASLAYAYESDRAFVELFPPMFEQLLPRIRRVLRAETVRFRLTHGPSRPAVEPVLRNLSFTPQPPWMAFSLARQTPLPKVAVPAGLKFRDAGRDDIPAMVRIDRESFPDTPMPAAALEAYLGEGGRALVATARGEIAGIALYSLDDPGEGYIRTLAVTETQRGRSIGAALTIRVAKKLFSEGATRVDLKTNEDNAAAIRLYVRLGFRHVAAGRDYQRPVDPKVIEEMRKANEGTLIKFGGWR